MHVHHICAWCPQSSKRESDPLVVSHQLDARTKQESSETATVLLPTEPSLQALTCSLNKIGFLHFTE